MRRGFTSAGASSALQAITTPTDGDVLVAGGGRFRPKAKGSAKTYFRISDVSGLPDYLVREDFVSRDHGLISWAFDPPLESAASPMPVAGTLHFTRLHVPEQTNVTNVILLMQSLGATLTAGQCFAALYSAAGALIGVTTDQQANWQTPAAIGPKVMPLVGGPFTVPAGDVLVAFWFQGTTGPSFCRGNGSASATTFSNVGLSAATGRFGAANTGLTTAAPATLSGMALSTFAYWAGIS